MGTVIVSLQVLAVFLSFVLRRKGDVFGSYASGARLWLTQVLSTFTLLFVKTNSVGHKVLLVASGVLLHALLLDSGKRVCTVGILSVAASCACASAPPAGVPPCAPSLGALFLFSPPAAPATPTTRRARIRLSCGLGGAAVVKRIGARVAILPPLSQKSKHGLL